jgi:WD40 repeat protein
MRPSACPLHISSLATGGHGGYLHTWDLERAQTPTWEVKAHTGIVNAIDGVGGRADGHGAPEIVTGGRDGCVRVWDLRQRDAPVASFEPTPGAGGSAPAGDSAESSASDRGDAAALGGGRDCWAVAFGNSFDNNERCVAAGYDNGDVKVFDLRAGGAVRYETNVGNGVCSVEFDRREIPMNKLVAACLEGALHAWDARTQHPVHGLARASAVAPTVATLWGVRHLPQNRELAMVQGGNGALWLYKYAYPDARVAKDREGVPMGVAGSLQLVTSFEASTQPIGAFDWSAEKEGLAVCGSFDQCVRVLAVTRLNKV